MSGFARAQEVKEAPGGRALANCNSDLAQYYCAARGGRSSSSHWPFRPTPADGTGWSYRVAIQWSCAHRSPRIRFLRSQKMAAKNARRKIGKDRTPSAARRGEARAPRFPRWVRRKRRVSPPRNETSLEPVPVPKKHYLR